MRRNLFLITLLLLCFSFSELAAGVDAAFLQKVNETEQLAYQDIYNGKVRDGLRQIIKLFREAPMNDTSYIEPLIGPYQLYVFTLALHNELIPRLTEKILIQEIYTPSEASSSTSSTDSSSGFREEEPLLEPSKYSSDQLLYTLSFAQESFSRTPMVAGLYQQMGQLLGSMALLPQALGVGLGVIAMPEHREVFGINTDMTRALGIGYIKMLGDTMLQKLFIEMYALRQLTAYREKLRELARTPEFTRLRKSEKELIELRKSGEEKYRYRLSELEKLRKEWNEKGITQVISKIEEWGVNSETIYSLSPGLNCISVGLPSMNLNNVNLDAIQVWADILRMEKDSQVRYILLSFLRLGIYMEEAHELLQNVFREISRESTPEGIFAKCLMCELDTKVHQPKDLYQRIIELTQLAALPGVISVRSLYEERRNALVDAYNYFERYGWYDYAIQVGEIIGPGYQMKCEQLKYDPLYMSLNSIYEVIGRLCRLKDEESLNLYFLEIAEHTPNPELRSKMIELSRNPLSMSRPVVKNPFPIEEFLSFKPIFSTNQQQSEQSVSK